MLSRPTTIRPGRPPTRVLGGMLGCALLLALLAALALAAPASAQLRYVGDRGLATVGRVACPAGGACQVTTPKRVKAKVGKRAFWAQVRAPKRVGPGKKATVRVKFGRGALVALAGRTTTVRVRIVLRAGNGARTVLLKIRLRRAALAEQPGGGTPESGPIGTEPPRLERPPTAVDVSVGAISWHPRDSWVRYVFSGQGMTFGAGAAGIQSAQSPCPDKPASETRPYTVAYVPAAGWYDPLSGRAAVYGSGSVRFRFAEHGIDLTAADPEVEIDGAASRAIFRVEGSGNTPFANQRAALLDLDLGGQPTVSDGGRTFTYELMRGRLTPDGVNVFAGFYTAPDNNQFGCVSVSFTTP